MSTPTDAPAPGFGGSEGRDVSRYVRVGMREVPGTADGPVIVGHAPASDHLRGPSGGVRVGALLTMLDMVGGLCGGLAALPDGWVVSTNLSARTVRLQHVGPFRIDARVLRQGRASVVTAVEIRDEGADDALVVDGVLTSAILVPENGAPQWDRPLVLDHGEPPAEPLPRIPEWLGIYAIDELTVEMALADTLRNPWGILHGGAVAALVDLAAEHATGVVTTDVVLHFLAPNRIGPVRASAQVIGTRPDGTVVRVELRDEGAGRITALAIVTAREAWSARRGVYPGSFDPPTIAHLAIAEAAVEAAALDQLDLAISRLPLGKDAANERSLETARVAALERLTVSRPWLNIVVTDHRLITDIAAGYDAVVMGADKWAQVRAAEWYDSADARDDALRRLPRVLVAPRPGFDVIDAEVLELPDDFGHVSSTAARAGSHHLIVPEVRRRLIVDGNNVIGSRPDGWWRDRPGAARRLVASLQDLARRSGDRISVVFDGHPQAEMPEGVHDGVLVAYAMRGGRDAADDRIVREVERDRDPSSLVVVTSDRGLTERVRALGAVVEGAGALLAQLD